MPTVEIFGVPRQRAGCAEATVHGETVATILAELELGFPGLRGLRCPDGSLSPHYLLSLDGVRFLTDPNERLEPGSRLLLLSADAGG
jgi:molybdopterin converting factor small subunit